MSSSYYYLNSYQKRGKMGISRKAFEDIATLAASGLQGVSVNKRSNSFFNLTSPVRAIFRKDGRVEVQIEVSLKKDSPVHDICLKIQEAIASAISMMVETVPVSIAVHVMKFR